MSDCLAKAGLAYPAGKRAGDRWIAEAALAAWALFEAKRKERGDREAFFAGLAFWSRERDRILAKLIGGRP